MNTYSIGIDIGGTNTDIGLVRDDGRVMTKKNLPTNKYFDASIYVSDIYDQIKALMADNDVTIIDGIGIAAPAGNYYTGCIENATNLNFKGIVDLAAAFRSHIDVPVVVSNDANAAAMGEMIFGAAKGLTDFVVITLGTGVGSGIVVNGDLVYGHDGFAGEVGHTTVFPGGRECGCGKKGCLESYASASGITRTVTELLCQTRKPSSLRDIPFNKLTSYDVFKAYQAGDEIAKETFEYTGKILGIKFADVVCHTSPSHIFLFGGPAKAGDAIINPAKKSMEEYLLPIFKNKIKIQLSGLMDKNAAVLGASALAWKELEK